MSANRGVGGILDHPVARVQIHVVGQHQQGRHGVDLELRALQGIETIGQPDETGLGSFDHLGPVFPRHDHDAVARLQVSDVRSDRDNLAAAFESAAGGQSLGPWITALEDQQIGRIDGTREDPDQHLVTLGRARLRRLDNLDDLARYAMTRELNGFHG